MTKGDKGQGAGQSSLKERSPGFKFIIAVVLGGLLMIPLLMVYALVWDRQNQSETARQAISDGWGDAQIIAGPVIAIPYDQDNIENFEENGVKKSRTVTVTRTLYLSPTNNVSSVAISPEVRRKSIYRAAVYEAKVDGKALFTLPEDVARLDIDSAKLKLEKAEIRFPIADPKGLLAGNKLTADGESLDLQPGNGLAISDGAGFFSYYDWSNGGLLELDYSYAMRGNGKLTLVPRGEETKWSVSSSWPHPNFAGDFLPVDRKVDEEGFTADYAISNLALGQSIIAVSDDAPSRDAEQIYSVGDGAADLNFQNSAVISLIEPVNLYSQVDRSVKYGFLFIGFTFITFLLFDIIAGARVASAEYLLTGAALILFFVMLLALSEVVGFTLAYIASAGAMIGMITAYSSAILKSRKRAMLIGAMLTGLYAVLFVLLNLEAYSLLAGSLMLFVALATIMFVTRHVDWSGVNRHSSVQAD